MVDNNPLQDGGSVGLSADKTPRQFERDDKGELVRGTLEKREIVQTLEGYRQESDRNRKSGLNPRDAKWEQNLDLYWNRYDFKEKAAWQAREVMPEVPSYVDRFAAALKEALISIPEGFYDVIDPADKEGDMAGAIKRMLNLWLSRAGRNQLGVLLPYSATFEEQMKLGALMACAQVVTWKTDVPNGRVAIETIDPRFVWLDHTNRNLYRTRRIEVDAHELKNMKRMMDAGGKPIYDELEMEQLHGTLMEDQSQKEQMTGSGAQISTSRKPVTLDEYIATVLDKDGKVVGERALFVVANQNYLVRGPEKNPFWHGSDWLTYTPLITTPLSVYGRSYMEDFGDVARTFTEMTNLILDAVRMSSLKAFAVVPSLLINSEQLAEGITSGKTFMLEDGVDPKMFWNAVDLGTLSPDTMRMWQELKRELSEAADMNEIGLGQFAPKGRTSATEINETQQSSSAMIRAVAQTIETRHLDVTLDLAWKTGLQHMDREDPMLRLAAGDEMFDAIWTERKAIIQRPITFQARGLSQMIRKSQMLRSLVGLLNMVAQNELLLKEFLQVVDMETLVKKLFELSGIDLTTLQASDREKMVRELTGQMTAGQGAAPQGPPSNGGVQRAMGSMLGQGGIARE